MFKEKNMFADYCRPEHEKPQFTMTEEIHHTMRKMRETIDRLLKFEERVKSDIGDLMRQITNDNVLFKDTMNNAHTLFLNEIKNEVSVFESTFESDVAMWKSEVESNYTNLSSSLQEQYASFCEAVNSRIDSNNTTHEQTFADYQRKLTTEINVFEANINNSIDTFIESVNTTLHSFKETWEAIIEARLNEQDGKISDNELYMRSNLEATITSLIGDMEASGKFTEIIEGEVFNDLERRIENVTAFVTPELYGAIGDGETDDTEALKMCLKSGNFVFLKGTYKISSVLNFDDLKNVVLYGGKIVRGKDERFNTIHGENCENIHIINVEFDGNGNNPDLTYTWSDSVQACIILCGNTSNIFIEKCIIKNFNYGVYTLGANFIENYLSKNATIKDCYFENVSSPIDTYGKGISIVHNILVDITGNAIQIEAEGTITNTNPLEDNNFYQSAVGCEISNNTFINVSGTCIIIHDNVYSASIKSNFMTNFGFGINANRTFKGCFVENNTLIYQNEIEVNADKRPWDLSYFAIYCGKNSHIKNNYLESCYVAIMGREGSVIVGNEIVKPKVSAIVVSSSDEILIHFIKDNIIKDFVKNSSAWYDSKPIVLNNGKAFITNNIVYADCEPIASISAKANVENLISSNAQTTAITKLSDNVYSN